MAGLPGRTGLPLLRGYQARTFLALARGIETRPGSTFTVLFPRQAGKNEVSATLAAFLLLAKRRARRLGAVVCAPTLHPQAAISQQRTLRAPRRRRPPAAGGGKSPRQRADDGVGRATAAFLSASPEATWPGTRPRSPR